MSKQTETESAEERLSTARAEQAKAEERLRAVRAEREAELAAGNATKARELRHSEAELEADLEDAARVTKHAETHLAEARAAQAKVDRAKLEARLAELEAQTSSASEGIGRAIEVLALAVAARRTAAEQAREARRQLYGGVHRDDGSTEAFVTSGLVERGILESREFRADLGMISRQTVAFDPQEQARRRQIEEQTRRSQALHDACELVTDAERNRAGWRAKIQASERAGNPGRAAEHRADLAAFDARVAAAQGLIDSEPGGAERLAAAIARAA